jgi:ABC-type nitrate/sulfonate/bicarbonate transport system permease component
MMTAIRPAPDATMLRRSRVPASRRRFVAAVVAVGKGAVGFAVVIGLWELGLALGVIKKSAAPSIGQFVSGIGNALGRGAVSATVSTLYAWALTLAISVAIGVVLGLLTGLSPWLDSLTSVLFDFVRPLPPIALLPAVVLVAGSSGRCCSACTTASLTPTRGSSTRDARCISGEPASSGGSCSRPHSRPS